MTNSPLNTFYTADRTIWRKWLENNFQTETDVWLVFPMKNAEEPRLSYNDAVEEALCFGWIDSTIKNIDETHRAQHFTQRRKNSPYSRPNIERLMWLEQQGMIHPSVLPSVIDLIRKPYEFPPDIIATIQADKQTWENYQAFSDSYKRIRIAYIDAARNRPEEFARRLNSFVAKTKQNKKIIGYGGIEKYY